jgi:hypothetical protein
MNASSLPRTSSFKVPPQVPLLRFPFSHLKGRALSPSAPSPSLARGTSPATLLRRNPLPSMAIG